jgi:heptosyltransferase-2
MTFRQRILLDRLLAVPLCVVCDIVARGVGRVLRRDHSIQPETTRQIVVSKLVGMGSILQATPLLRALKKSYPRARLTFLTLESNRALLERLDGVDEILCLRDCSAPALLWTTLRVLAGLNRRRVDHYFDLEVYSAFACLLSVFSLARNRFGFYRHSNRFKKGIYTHLVYFNTRMPVRRIYLQLGRLAGAAPDPDDRLGPLRVTPADRQRLWEKLAAAGLKQDEPYVAVNPNASDLLIERRWPEGHMVSALTRLADLGHNLVLLGSASEAAFVQSLCDRLPAAARARVHNTAGQLSLGEAFALLEGAACVLTNDTGPMHMAFALGRPTVCLVGPADPVHYGVDRPDVVTLYAAVCCSPCIYEVDEPPCRGNNVCMQRLSPEWVVHHVRALMARTRGAPAGAEGGAAAPVERPPLIWETDAGQLLGIVLRPSRR